jgi:chitinase
MTYDFAGYWNPRTGFNAPLYPWGEEGAAALGGDTAVRAYLDAGVPPGKLVLGVPFYGRAFAGVNDENHGLAQKHSAKPPRATGSGLEWSWRSIAKHYLDQGPTRHWHDQAKVPWLYDREKKLFITYDDPESLKLKAQYVRDQSLGGVMIWELSQDDEKSTLLDALHDGLRP